MGVSGRGLVDGTFGRLVAWIGRHVERGTMAEQQRSELLNAVGAAVCPMVAAASQMGVGLGFEVRHAAEIAEGIGRLLVAAGEINDAELSARIAALRAIAQPFIHREVEAYRLDELERASDAVVARVRELRQGG